MANPIEDLRVAGHQERVFTTKLAKIVIGDSIGSAYAQGVGLPTTWGLLEALKDNRGDRLSRIALAQYVCHESAAIREKVTPSLDARIFASHFKAINMVSDKQLKADMIQEIEGYLSLSESEQEAYRTKFASQPFTD